MQIACGKNFTLALSISGCVYSSGDNTYGQLGLGHTFSQPTFGKIEKFGLDVSIHKISASTFSGCLSTDGKAFIWGQIGPVFHLSPFELQSCTKIVDMSCGNNFVIFVDKNS